MHLKPLPGLTIPMPEAHGRPLPPEGAEVPNTEYWRRRIADGDVTILATAPVLAAPLTQAVPLSIALSPSTVAVQNAVALELADFFLREAAPGGTLRRSRLIAAISAAAGETWHTLSVPSADVVLPAGTIATLGAITWL